MWDPISIFFCAYILNIGMPDARLNVGEVIKANEERLVTETIIMDAKVREGA